MQHTLLQPGLPLQQKKPPVTSFSHTLVSFGP
jgi:hypothetical protein